MSRVGAGRLTLPAPETKARGLRYAPGFEMNPDLQTPTDRAKPYTAETVAVFLGWLEPSGHAKRKVHTALAALELIEAGVFPPTVTFAGTRGRV